MFLCVYLWFSPNCTTSSSKSDYWFPTKLLACYYYLYSVQTASLRLFDLLIKMDKFTLSFKTILWSCWLCVALSFYLHKGFGWFSPRQRVWSMTEEIINVGVVLVAGGAGKRMNSSIPKQFLKLNGESVLTRSLKVFLRFKSEVTCVVVVLDKKYRIGMEQDCWGDTRIKWADPGPERQDSVYNGLLELPSSCAIACIHDAARPLVSEQEIRDCLLDGQKFGAAVLGVPVKATLKESQGGGFVSRTLDRSTLWEIQTPQVAKRELFLKGFDKIHKENLSVTDDVSVIEALQLPVKITQGQYTNIKITTPDDLTLAEEILRNRVTR